MTKTTVILEGFLINVSSPDSMSLAINVDCTALRGDKYLALIRELEDALSRMDQSYTERSVRGRSLRGHYRRHLMGPSIMRTRRLTFVPYPSKMINRPGNMRRNLYYELNANCLNLQRETIGRRHRVTYLLPYVRAPSMMLYIEGLNREIRKINDELLHLKKQEVSKVLKILDKYGVDGNIAIPERLHEFSLNLRPVTLDPQIVEDLVEHKYKEQFDRLREGEKQGLELLQQELDRQRRILVTEAIEKLRRQLESIASRFIGTKKFSPKQARQDLERLKEIAESTGLSALATTAIDPLIQIAENPEKAEELIGNKDPVQGVSMRIQGLIESL